MTYRDIFIPLVPILAALLLMGGLVLFAPDKGDSLPATPTDPNAATNGNLIVCQDTAVGIDPNLIVTDEDGKIWGVIDDPCDPTAIRLVQESNTYATEISIDPNEPIEPVTLWDSRKVLATIRGTIDKPLLDVNDPNCLTDASIRLLASSGRLCRTLHHTWELHFEGGVITNTDPTGEEMRTCLLCGRVERNRLVKSHWTGWEVVAGEEVRP